MEGVITKVAIERGVTYDSHQLSHSLDLLLDNLGGLSKYVSPGDRVLLKVNLLSPKKPERAVTTHPEIVKVLCGKITELGGIPTVGDSAGGISPKRDRTSDALRISGIQQAAEEAGGEIVNFDQAGAQKVSNKGDLTDESDLYIAKPVLEADTVINLPKLKTHGLTFFTGAVKNMYGAIPGAKKREYHGVFPDREGFSKLLCDIYQTTKPHLTIMDGVWAMEGNGPSAGKRKDLGLLLAGQDGVALDAVAAQIIGFQPMQVPSTRIAHQNGLGQGVTDNIQICGEDSDLSFYRVNGFQLPLTSRALDHIPSGLIRFAMNQMKTVPRINQQICTKCGICHKSCPVDAIVKETDEAGQWFYKICHGSCIDCLCCHELCPEEAVGLDRKSLLGRVFFGKR